MLLDEKAAASYLSVAPSTLRVLRCTGGRAGGLEPIPFIRMGRRIAYDVRDLESYAAARRVNPNGEGAA